MCGRAGNHEAEGGARHGLTVGGCYVLAVYNIMASVGKVWGRNCSECGGRGVGRVFGFCSVWIDFWGLTFLWFGCIIGA